MTRLDPDPTASSDAGFAAIEAALATLAEPAPGRLGHDVLVRVGLADDYALIDSPLGQLRVAWNGRGISAVDGSPDDRSFEQAFLARTGRRAERVDALPPRLAGAVERRLAGDRRARIDLDLRGSTEFEQAVWLEALEIPRGQVRPYGWIAAEIGRPRRSAPSGRRSATTDPADRPCHRVVRTDGFIGQYSLGGPENKRTILAAEGPTGRHGPLALRDPVRGLRHDADLLHADLPRRPADHGATYRSVPLGAGGGRRGLPALPTLPSVAAAGAA